MNKVILSLGSNLGDRKKKLELVEKYLSEQKINIISKTKILETKALEVTDQPDFLNQLILIQTNLEPIELLDILQEIEKKIGRIFRYEKGPREIDIDILTFNNLTLNHKRLVLPHHSIKTRPFIKELLSEI